MNSRSFDDRSHSAQTGAHEAQASSPLSDNDPAFAAWKGAHPTFLRDLLEISDELAERWLRGTVTANSLVDAREDLATVRRLELAALLCRAARIRVAAAAELDDARRAWALGAYLDGVGASDETRAHRTAGVAPERRSANFEPSDESNDNDPHHPVVGMGPHGSLGARERSENGSLSSTDLEQWKERVRALLLHDESPRLPRSLRACCDQEPSNWPSPLELTRSAWMLAPSFRLRTEMARACVSQGELVRAEAIYHALWRDAVTRPERSRVLGGVASISEMRGDSARALRCWLRASELRADNAIAAVSALAHAICEGREEDARIVAERIGDGGAPRDELLFATTSRALFAHALAAIEDPRLRPERSPQRPSSATSPAARSSRRTPAEIEKARRLRVELIGLGHPTLTDVCLELS